MEEELRKKTIKTEQPDWSRKMKDVLKMSKLTHTNDTLTKKIDTVEEELRKKDHQD